MEPKQPPPKPEGKRWERRRDKRPAEIVAAAVRLFARKGFVATRMDEVAEAAGVTKGTIYLYFPDKEALLRAAIEGTAAPRVQQALQHLSAGGSATAALTAFVQQLALRLKDPALSSIPKILVSEAGNFEELAEVYFRTVIEPVLAAMRSLLRRGIRSGEFRSGLGDLDQITLQLIAPMLIGVLWQHTFGHLPDAADRFRPDRGTRDRLAFVLRALQP